MKAIGSNLNHICEVEDLILFRLFAPYGLMDEYSCSRNFEFITTRNLPGDNPTSTCLENEIQQATINSNSNNGDL